MSDDRAKYLHEYNRRPDVKARMCDYQKDRCRQLRLKTTQARIQKHSCEDMVEIFKHICAANCVNFEGSREQIESVARLITTD